MFAFIDLLNDLRSFFALFEVLAFIEIILEEVRLLACFRGRNLKFLVLDCSLVREPLAEVDPLEAWKELETPQDVTEL